MNRYWIVTAGTLAVVAASVFAENPKELRSHKLYPSRFADGSGQIYLPEDWRMTFSGRGACEASGPEGQQLTSGFVANVMTPAHAAWLRRQAVILGMPPEMAPVSPLVADYCDPGRAVAILFDQFNDFMMKHGAAPERFVKVIDFAPCDSGAGKAAYVVFTTRRLIDRKPVTCHYFARVCTVRGDAQQWTYMASCFSAPEPVFKRDMQLMSLIYQSYTLNQKEIDRRFGACVRSMKEANEIFRESQIAWRRSRDRQNADFIEVIQGTRTVEDRTGFHRPREAQLGHVTEEVDYLNEKEGWQRYREVPLRDQ